MSGDNADKALFGLDSARRAAEDMSMQILERMFVHLSQELLCNWESRFTSDYRIYLALRALGSLPDSIRLVAPRFDFGRQKDFQTIKATAKFAPQNLIAVQARMLVGNKHIPLCFAFGHVFGC